MTRDVKKNTTVQKKLSSGIAWRRDAAWKKSDIIDADLPQLL